MGIRQDAFDAQRLSDDTAFKYFVAKVRQQQLDNFANSGISAISEREEAHAILRALNQIEAELDRAVTSGKLLDRKEQGIAP